MPPSPNQENLLLHERLLHLDVMDRNPQDDDEVYSPVDGLGTAVRRETARVRIGIPPISTLTANKKVVGFRK